MQWVSVGEGMHGDGRQGKVRSSASGLLVMLVGEANADGVLVGLEGAVKGLISSNEHPALCRCRRPGLPSL